MMRASCWSDMTPCTRTNAYQQPSPLLQPQQIFKRKFSEFLPFKSKRNRSSEDLLIRQRKMTSEFSSKVRFFPDLNSALCWCESHLLAIHRIETPQSSMIFNQLCVAKEEAQATEATPAGSAIRVLDSLRSSNQSCDSLNPWDDSDSYTQSPQSTPSVKVSSILTNLLISHIPRRASRKALRVAAAEAPTEFFERERLVHGSLLWR